MVQPLTLLPINKRVAKHEALIAPYANAFIKRRSFGLKHPVHDFLFTYYSCSPQKLKQWVPSVEESVEFLPWLDEYWFCSENGWFSHNPDRLHDAARGLASFVNQLCKNILDKPPRFNCFGLHEWAMVYKSQNVRHESYPLRLSPKEIATFVESQTICCSHYDAYRFFTPEAKPFNILRPVLDTRLHMEQAGCLHANMDLYKWGVKLWPWIGSDYLAQAFLYALECRELDMRASPYDLSSEGYSPICIETEQGRLEYKEIQRSLSERSIPLRKELLRLSHKILSFR